MKPDMPDSGDLLRAAMDVMKRDILPTVPEDKMLDALMILSVMGAAERDLADGDGLAARQAERLKALLPEGGNAADLSDAIRRGTFDAPHEAARLHATLMEDVRDRLSLVNPKYLAAADKEPGTDV
jgi:hypothetical protein